MSQLILREILWTSHFFFSSTNRFDCFYQWFFSLSIRGTEFCLQNLIGFFVCHFVFSADSFLTSKICTTATKCWAKVRIDFWMKTIWTSLRKFVPTFSMHLHWLRKIHCATSSIRFHTMISSLINLDTSFVVSNVQNEIKSYKTCCHSRYFNRRWQTNHGRKETVNLFFIRRQF